MSTKVRFNKTVYNGGAELLAAKVSLEAEMNLLKSTATNIRETLKGLNTIEKFDISAIQHNEDPFFNLPTDLESVFKRQIHNNLIIFAPHSSLASALTSILSEPVKGKFVDVISRNKERIETINAELRRLKAQLKANFSKELLKEVRSLVMELRDLISFQLQRKRLRAKSLCLCIRYFFTRDLRNCIRLLIAVIYKFLCDCSGSEEEESLFTTTNNSKQFFPFFKFKSQCITRKILFNPSMSISSQCRTN